jgi:hypothetical protein
MSKYSRSEREQAEKLNPSKSSTRCNLYSAGVSSGGEDVWIEASRIFP